MATAQRLLSAATALLALTSAAHTLPEILAPGMPAPPLSVQRWIKGSPVESITLSGIYVVEFWATWCGPCAATAPFLTATAKQNPDVAVLGISIWEEDRPAIDRFVKKMGAKMDYHVGYSGDEDGMGETWMRAAGQSGIPTAFVVKDGVIQWIGHPLELDGVLAKVKAGTFDIETFKKAFAKSTEPARKEMALLEALRNVEKRYATDRVGAKAALSQLVRDNRKARYPAEALRLEWLAGEDPKAWEAKAKDLAKSGRPRAMTVLLDFAYGQALDANAASARRAMAIALQAEPKGYDALEYASRVYRVTRDYDKALEAIGKMLVYFPTGQVGGQPGFKAELLSRKAEILSLKSPRPLTP